jgi:hypothetical protein
MLAVVNVRGALVPNISGSMGTDCGPLRRRHSAEKAVPLPSAARRLLNLLLTEGGDTGGGWFIMNKIARSKRIKNVVSLQAARERRRRPRGDSNRHVSKGLLERLEAENAQLRGSVVELVLQIKALRDALGLPQSET